MFDFDGTLAPLTATPEETALPEETRALLRQCLEHMPVAIVSGRAMADLERRVNIPNIALIANHGVERRINGERHVADLSRTARRSLVNLHHRLIEIQELHPGTVLEDKTYSVVFHYRRIPQKTLIPLKMQLYIALQELNLEGIEVTENEKSLEFRIQGLWNKGDAVRYLIREFGGWRSDTIPSLWEMKLPMRMHSGFCRAALPYAWVMRDAPPPLLHGRSDGGRSNAARYHTRAEAVNRAVRDKSCLMRRQVDAPVQ